MILLLPPPSPPLAFVIVRQPFWHERNKEGVENEFVKAEKAQKERKKDAI